MSWYAEICQSPNGRRLLALLQQAELPSSKEETARRAGIAVEDVSRTVRAFQMEGRLKKVQDEGRCRYVLNEAPLGVPRKRAVE